MSAETQVYRDLQKHLDRMPVGYPATESGVEIRILKHLFTPDEARLALQLSMLPEPVERIHKRVKKTGMSRSDLEQMLERMFQKGLILRTTRDGEKRYSNALLAIGMYEFQVGRMTKEFAADVEQYFDEAFVDEASRTKIPQLRTIPVEKSVPAEHHVSDYDSVRRIVDQVDGQFAVANCICRQAKDLIGESCRLTDLRESCLILRDVADDYVSMGIGRPISKQEALEILDKAQEAGLVLQPANSLRPVAICCCCGDCCGVLTAVKKMPCPAEYYATNHYAAVDPELCTGCEECVDRCQLDAIAVTDGMAGVNLDRCIGCGNCVVVCPADAISLRDKDKELVPPKNTEALYMSVLSKRIGKANMLKVGVKTLLGMKV